MSDIPSTEETIVKTTYRAYTLPIDRWEELTELLAGVLGEPLANLLRGDAVIPDGNDPRLGGDDIREAIGAMATKLRAGDMKALRRYMGESLQADGKPLPEQKQRLWWSSHMREYAGAVSLFLRVQYADFFEGLSGCISQLPSAAPARSDGESDSSPSPSR